MQLSRPQEVRRLHDDDPRTDPKHGIRVGELRQRDEKGCLGSNWRPDAPGLGQV